LCVFSSGESEPERPSHVDNSKLIGLSSAPIQGATTESAKLPLPSNNTRSNNGQHEADGTSTVAKHPASTTALHSDSASPLPPPASSSPKAVSVEASGAQSEPSLPVRTTPSPHHPAAGGVQTTQRASPVTRQAPSPAHDSRQTANNGS